MPIEGMDVEQLQGLARQIDSDAQTLSRVMAAITGVAGELVLLWRGAVADAFEQDWRSRSRPALQAAYNTLTDLHAHLVSNISQQTSASAAEGGWTAERIVGDSENVATAVGLADLIHDLSGKAYNPRTKAYKEYEKAWNKLIKLDHDSPFLKYHESSVLRYVHDAKFVQQTDKILVRTHIADFLGPVGLFLGAADAGVNTTEALVDLKDHHYNDAIQHIGSAVEDAGPVGLLAGGAIKLIDDDYQLGKQIQWSQGAPNPFSGNNFQTDWLPSIEEAPVKTAEIVTKAFFG
jgi:uncharacterized protein YukE